MIDTGQHVYRQMGMEAREHLEGSSFMEQVERLFEKAIELSPAERSLFLDGTCAEHPLVRLEIERLIEAYDDAPDFFYRLAEVVKQPLDERAGRHTAGSERRS